MRAIRAENMARRILATAALGLVLSIGAPAQNIVEVYGQFFLPSGGLPTESIRLYLTRDDGAIHDYFFTDSKGSFQLHSLTTAVSYTITVTSDGANYGNTVFNFLLTTGRQQRIVITLNPLPRKRLPPESTLSAASAYRPVPPAGSLYDQAMRDIKKNRAAAAEQSLRRAVAADPKYAAACHALGALLMLERKYAEAEKFLRQAIQDDPKSPGALLNLGETLNRLRKYSDAIPPLREALRLEPGLLGAHQQLGVALVETDQFAEARQVLTGTLNASGADKALVEFYLGKLYARTGELEKSIGAFNVFLKLAPDAPQAAEVRALLERMRGQLAARR